MKLLAQNGPIMDALREQEPVEVSGPAGTVVLWVGVTAHVVGQNKHSDVIRQASICQRRNAPFSASLCLALADTGLLPADEFHKSVEAMPDELLRQRIAITEGETIPDIWDDWSEAVRAAPVAAEGPAVGVTAEARL